jgi:hypothetical protein
MNRTIVVVVLLTVLEIGQSDAQLLRTLGAKVAVTSASQTYNYANPLWPNYGPDLKRRTGFNAAVYAEWLNIPFFSVVTQLEYAQRGYVEELAVAAFEPGSIGAVGTFSHTNRLDYLSLPILLKVTASRGMISPYVLIGPRIDMYLGYRDNILSTDAISEQFKKTILGGSAGVGLELRTLLPVALSLEFRYNADFVDSYDTGSLKIRNNTYDLWLGVAL